MQQKTIFKDVLAVLAVFSLLFMGYYTYHLINHSKSYIAKEAEAAEVGMGQELSGIVDSLEYALVERTQLQYYSKIDPLNLMKILVIESPELLEWYEQSKEAKEKEKLKDRDELKLTATILGEDQKKAIFLDGEKYVSVRVGATINNRKVLKIEDGSVVVEENGKQKTYTIKKKGM